MTRSTELTISGVLQRAYRSYGSALALELEGRRLTYADLGTASTNLARRLLASGLSPGDRVALVMNNRPEFFIIEHAIFHAGLVRVGLSPKAHLSEVEFVVEDSGASAVFADAEWHERIGRSSVMFDGRLVNVDDPDHFTVEVDGENTAAKDLPVVPADDIAALLYTSGSTGQPKGAIHTQGTIAAIARNHLTEIQPIDDGDVLLHIGPLAHMSGVFSWAYFCKGATHLTHNRFDVDLVLSDIDRCGITTLLVVPTMLNRLTEAALSRNFSGDSIRTIMYGASPIAPDKLAAAIAVFGDVFVQAYGQSEGQLVSALSRAGHRPLDDGTSPQLASAGRPSPFVEVRIAADDDVEVPLGATGEIQIRSDTVMAGYFGRPDETDEVLLADGWLRTGDVGRLDESGFLYITDRRRDMIVTGGYNVYPAEVEASIGGIDGVKEVAVIGAPDDAWGEAVTAVVECESGHTLTAEHIISHCKARLSSYKVPKVVDFTDHLPRTPVGKISRKDVREQYWRGQARRVG